MSVEVQDNEKCGQQFPEEHAPLQIKMRGSASSYQTRCGQSLIPPAVPRSGAGRPARIGTGVHLALSDAIQKEYGPDKVEETILDIASRLDLDRDEIAPPVFQGLKDWEKLRDHFPGPLLEVAMSRREKFEPNIEVEVTGHADVLALDGAEIRCLDWKSGWLDTDHKPQIRMYALLAFTEFPEAQTFWGSALRLRTGDMEPYKWTREEIETWWASALREISRMAYNQGDWCQYCPRARECPANLQDLEVSGKLLAGAESFTPDQLPAIYRAKQAYQKLIDRAGDAIKAMVAANGGSMQFADSELRIRSEERQAIEPTQASLDLIAGAIPNVWPILKITKTAVENEVRAVAPPRQGAKKFRELMTDLEHAGAVKKTIVEKLELKRIEVKQ